MDFSFFLVLDNVLCYTMNQDSIEYNPDLMTHFDIYFIKFIIHSHKCFILPVYDVKEKMKKIKFILLFYKVHLIVGKIFKMSLLFIKYGLIGTIVDLIKNSVWGFMFYFIKNSLSYR